MPQPPPADPGRAIEESRERFRGLIQSLLNEFEFLSQRAGSNACQGTDVGMDYQVFLASSPLDHAMSKVDPIPSIPRAEIAETAAPMSQPSQEYEAAFKAADANGNGVSSLSEGEVVAEVRAPLELDAEQVERLRLALERATNRRVQVKVIVDPSVIGGVVTKIGDTVLDGSIQSRFVELREHWG